MVEKPVTHVLVRESTSPAKRASPIKTRRQPSRKAEKAEITLDSSSYEFSKDYAEEERAYQELRSRNRSAVESIKETHYEDDEEEDSEEAEEDEAEEAEGEGEEEDYEFDYEDEDGFQDNEPEDFVLQPRQSFFTPLKNLILFAYFFVHNLIASIYRALISFFTRCIELFIFIPLLWIVESFKVVFNALSNGVNNVLAALGATVSNDLVKKSFALLIAITLLTFTISPALQFLNQHHVLDSLSNLRFRLQSTYTPPDLPPSTAEEIVDRLLDLERHLSTYSGLHAKVLEQNKLLQQDNAAEKVRRGAIDESIYLLKQDLEKLNAYAKQSTSQLADLKLFNKDTKESIKDLHSVILRLDSEVGKHESEMRSRATASEKLSTEIKALKSNIDALKRGLTSVEAELKRVSDYDVISKVALKAIQDYLPSQLAVRVNPKSKKIEINPDFWTALRRVFADREEVGRSVAAQMEKMADPKTAHKEASWTEFLKGNEEAVKAFIKVQMDDRWNKAGEDGAIVSREYFLEILRGHITELQGDMESKMKTLVEKLEKSSKDSLAKAVASADAVFKKAQKMGGRGELSTEAMNSIIETALHRYSTDTLAKPDYALYSSGARINPLLTSPTYYHLPKSIVKRIGSYLFGGAGSTWGHQPAMALFQDTNVGMCWAFPGSQGGLGIRLSEAVLVTDVSVEHVHRDISKNIGSAPRQWSLYGLVTDDNARAQIESINAGLYDSLPPVNLPRGYTLLVKGEYDINNGEGKTIQTVPVPAAIRRLNVPIEQVVFAVGSNWGNAEYTCLYRVRVHGQGLPENEDGDKGFGDDEVV